MPGHLKVPCQLLFDGAEGGGEERAGAWTERLSPSASKLPASLVQQKPEEVAVCEVPLSKCGASQTSWLSAEAVSYLEHHLRRHQLQPGSFLSHPVGCSQCGPTPGGGLSGAGGCSCEDRS